MSRYLTPSKIGYLALISLYTDSVIPSTATVPILSFLVSQLLPSNVGLISTKSELSMYNVAFAINAFQEALIGHVSGIPGRTVWDLFLQKIWKIDSFDVLQTFFDGLSSLMQKTSEEKRNEIANGVDSKPTCILLGQVSPLGSFVRKAQLEFTRLPFHEGVSLWRTFVAYRAPTLSQWRRRNPSAGITSFDRNLHDAAMAREDPLAVLVYGGSKDRLPQLASTSTEDIEKLLDHQVENMQSRPIQYAQDFLTDQSRNTT